MTSQAAPDLSPPATLRAAALVPILRHFGGAEAIDLVLRRNGLDPGRITDPYEIIPLSAYLTIFEECARTALDPVLGARIGQSLSPMDLGPTGVLFWQSASIRRGLERFLSSLSALQSATEMDLWDDGHYLNLSYQIRAGQIRGQPQDTEFSLSGMCQMIRMSFDPRWTPAEVHFTHAPSPRADLLARIFRAPVLFGQSANRVLFDRAGVDTPYRTEDSALIAVIERHVADLVLGQDPGASFAERALRVVSHNLGQRPVDIGTVAAELGVTARTLQRRLRDEGTSLRAITQGHRQRIVEIHLSQPDMNLRDVAQALGYSDGTVFWRAYRHWTGTAPSKRAAS